MGKFAHWRPHSSLIRYNILMKGGAVAMGIIYTVTNKKGGVGKSTSVLNLGYVLTQLGKKVLLVDLDPQGNLSICMDIDRKKADEVHTITERLLEVIEDKESPDAAQYPTLCGDLALLPCNAKLDILEDKLKEEIGSERTLLEALAPYVPLYDYILVDTSPTLGLLTINALVAADKILIISTPDILSANGISMIADYIKKIKKRINPSIEIAGILLNMCNERTNVFKNMLEILDSAYGSRIGIFKTRIPMSVKVSEANLEKMPVVKYAPSNKVSQAFIEAAKELIDNGR